MPESDDPFHKAADGLDNADLGLGPATTKASNVHRSRVHWLWPGRLPKGKLVILDGDPDVGKSTLLLDIAARLTTGTPMPDGYIPLAPANVLFLGAEDGMADTVVPRLMAAGADLTRFMSLDGMPIIDDAGRLSYREPELPTDVEAVEELCRREEIGLIIIDPLVAYLADWVNSHKDQQIRRALTPLSKMAERTGATVCPIRHLNKSSEAPALYRGGGSIGILAAARLVLVAAHDPDNEGGRVLASLKSNIAVKAETLAYRIVPNELYDVGEISWQGTSPRSAAEILALSAATADPDERSKLEAAVAFLFASLVDGPRRSREILKEATELLLSERTLERAKRAAGIRVTKEADGWYWSLPSPDELLD